MLDDEWIVSFGPLDGYAIAQRNQWQRWLPPGNSEVLLLHRNAPAAAAQNLTQAAENPATGN